MYKKKLSALIITKNSDRSIEQTLISLNGLVDEIIIIDDYSNDNTTKIASKYGSTIYKHKYQGEWRQRRFGLGKVNTLWVLGIDSDEVISPELKDEIKNAIKKNTFKAYEIPFQSYYKKTPLYFGGESYKKIELFQKKYIKIPKKNIHSGYESISINVGTLKGVIHHYSYPTLWHTYVKFTKYAYTIADEMKKKGENTSLKKLTLYPIHMIWQRFIKDEGYRDGLFRLPLDIGFGYMEFCIYFFLLYLSMRKK